MSWCRPLTARELLQEERRLFYVACTRARSRLVVTAVASAEDDGEQQSRFIDELGVAIEHVVGRPPRPLSLAGLVGDLRRTLADPETSPPLRDAAARRLARLAGESVGTRPLVPQADPSSWWGTRAATRSVQPVRPPDRPVPLSATLVENVMVCPTRWFLVSEAGGTAPAHQSANIGQIVHALAERVATGEVDADVETLMGHVDEVWGRLHFRTPWSAAREHDRVAPALARFVDWHRANPRRLLATEAKFSTEVELDSGERVTSRATPTASRSTPTAGSSSSTSRPPRARPPDRPSRATSSSASTSTPSTTAPSTTCSTTAARARRRVRRRGAGAARAARR